MDLKGILRRLEGNLRNQPGNIMRKSGEKIVTRYSIAATISDEIVCLISMEVSSLCSDCVSLLSV
jgi:hypothetical protein